MTKPMKLIDILFRRKKNVPEYGPEDYASAYAVDRLYSLGELGEAIEVETQHGEYLNNYESMDPMELLILIEEHDNGCTS